MRPNEVTKSTLLPHSKKSLNYIVVAPRQSHQSASRQVMVVSCRPMCPHGDTSTFVAPPRHR
uniref:Uncharacterized protein n=1 Tax=Zea mays TaxID=4577 RepID=C0P2B5_MAIZE|nr:unknown [Zea mays]ACR33893.1 unknown [Zea mays]